MAVDGGGRSDCEELLEMVEEGRVEASTPRIVGGEKEGGTCGRELEPEMKVVAEAYGLAVGIHARWEVTRPAVPVVRR